jgi:membrane protein implicated in regulation of membrane protease activity
MFAEWLRESQWLWWLGAALVFGLLEVVTLDLVFSMLVVAAVVAAAAALAGASFTVQVLLFAGTAALMLAVARPLALRKLKPAGPGERTNVAAHVGRQAVVISTVTARDGRVKLAGEEWSARSVDPGRAFAADEVVEVVAIDGAVAVVGPPTPRTPITPEGQEAP